ncbi:thiamine phosphate synthase [Clostridium sp. 'White wine YQ']|uniref:thiamine phosphate synthase n=1 Tax=Clostridium sp. 'White wine YQ' TaxID=3027474 RepID=UPI00236674D8|nr:thiamine phosphate synthase [Clostridium sp. 'White wine YQ']MDD7794436.1 thiamine phosphate synthase [Clostridium sp. 'White wine YQ']
MLICVTNRKLCKDDFLDRLNLLAKGKPYGIMLREKDLSQFEYESLAIKVKEICDINKVPLIINQNIDVALKLDIPNIQLSMNNLRSHATILSKFKNIGASVHSVEEAREAQELGATYLIAGHIFPTDCKKGVPERGLSFLQEVCNAVSIPVFAIGGITDDKLEDVKNAGSTGVCVMSESMTCPDPINFIKRFT